MCYAPLDTASHRCTCVHMFWTLHTRTKSTAELYIQERRGEERGENDERMRLCPALITENEQL